MGTRASLQVCFAIRHISCTNVGKTGLRRISVVILLVFLAAPETSARATSTPYVIPPISSRVAELKRLETFLLNLYNPELGLVRESPDSSIDRTYWLLSDNLLASLALQSYYPEKAKIINTTLWKYGYVRDGMHEVLLGKQVEFPPRTPETITFDKLIIHKTGEMPTVADTLPFTIRTETRSGKLMDDWIDYADLLCYASINEWNAGHREMAKNYFFRILDMWNGVGLFDKPTRLDGFYSTYKLALLLYTSRLIGESIAYRLELERILWSFQREDGGVRSHYLGNLTSKREANVETASLILIAYNLGFDKASEVLFKNPHSEALGEDIEKRKAWFTQESARNSYVMTKKQYDDAVRYFETRSFELAVMYAEDAYANYRSALSQEQQHRTFIAYLTQLALVGGVFAVVIILGHLQRSKIVGLVHSLIRNS